MHCPSCGQLASSDQQFCRTCGMNLQEIGKLVVQHSATPTEVQKKLDKAEYEQLVLRRMFNFIMWGMIIIGLGVLMLVANKSGLVQLSSWFSLLTSCFFVAGACVATAGIVNGIRQGIALPRVASRAEIAQPMDTKSLPTNPMPVALPSITERTTQLIPEKEASIDSNRHE